MKQYKIIEAYKTLEVLADNTNLTKEEQWSLYLVRKFLRPHIEFQDEQENLIHAKYRPFADENGALPADKTQDILNELNDVSQLDKDLGEFKKHKIRMVDGINFKIIEPLEEFIEFTQE